VRVLPLIRGFVLAKYYQILTNSSYLPLSYLPLSAYDNEFSGSIPAEFASLKNLKNFVVAENKLSGSIPEEFGYMPQLELFSAYRRL
jgi:Leucine-rich repeat (LRR) protein